MSSVYLRCLFLVLFQARRCKPFSSKKFIDRDFCCFAFKMERHHVKRMMTLTKILPLKHLSSHDYSIVPSKPYFTTEGDLCIPAITKYWNTVICSFVFFTFSFQRDDEREFTLFIERMLVVTVECNIVHSSTLARYASAAANWNRIVGFAISPRAVWIKLEYETSEINIQLICSVNRSSQCVTRLITIPPEEYTWCGEEQMDRTQYTHFLAGFRSN